MIVLTLEMNAVILCSLICLLVYTVEFCCIPMPNPVHIGLNLWYTPLRQYLSDCQKNCRILYNQLLLVLFVTTVFSKFSWVVFSFCVLFYAYKFTINKNIFFCCSLDIVFYP